MERAEHTGSLVTGLNSDNWYFVKPVFKNEMVDFIHSLASNTPEERATEVGRDGNSLEENLNSRSSSICWIDDMQVYEVLMDAIESVNDGSWQYNITGIESLQYTIYREDKNQHYSWHTDPINYKDSTIPSRKVSCSVLLSDPEEFEGGEFEFMSIDLGGQTSSSFQPNFFNKKGHGLFFPSQAYHRVKPVTKGIRRSLVCWFTGPRP
jgi:PKHD-type hydroxylase